MVALLEELRENKRDSSKNSIFSLQKASDERIWSLSAAGAGQSSSLGVVIGLTPKGNLADGFEVICDVHTIQVRMMRKEAS